MHTLNSNETDVTQQLFINTNIATLTGSGYGFIENGAMAIKDGIIHWVGARAELGTQFSDYDLIDLSGRLITPALIDCHTHLVYGGNRAREFELRLEGASYQEIAKAGGGIVSTVAATRALSENHLITESLPRLDHLIKEGVSTIEIKSGYGLTIKDELKMLRVARRLESLRRVRIKTTFLAAHAVPIEYQGRADDYIEEVCLPAMTQGAEQGLIDAVDGFCEGIGFSPAQIKRVFEHAKALKLPVKLHAEQLSDLKGAVLAADYGALSVDHLEYLAPVDVPALKHADTVAVLLPGAFYALRETKLPPIDAFRKHHVPMALATDSNPGSSPLTSLLLAMNMGCTLFQLTPQEALKGVTSHAAKALGLEDQIGQLSIGKRAELAIWDVDHPCELSYHIGFTPLYKRVFGEFEQ